jgi:hypothetical protein
MFEQPFDDVPVTTKAHVAAFGLTVAGKIETQHSTRAREKATLVQPVVGVAAEAMKKHKCRAGALVHKVDSPVIPHEEHLLCTVRG